MGQPTISKAVAQLEERLGVRLLLRSTRRLNLTDVGKTFYENAKRAIEHVNQAELAARGDAGLSGTLRVSAPVCFARIHVLPRLPEFLAMHPEVDIDVVMDDRIVNLVEEGVDLGASNGRPHGSLADGTQDRPGAPAGDGDGRVLRGPRGAEDAGRSPGARGGDSPAPRGDRRPGLVRSVLDDWTLPSKDLWAAFPAGQLVNAKARAFVLFVERCMAGLEHPRLMRVGNE